MPASRQDAAYAVLRSFVGGQVFVAVTLKNSTAPRLREVLLLSIAALQCSAAAARLAWAWAWAFSPDRATVLRLRLASTLGKLRWRALAGLYGPAWREQAVGVARSPMPG